MESLEDCQAVRPEQMCQDITILVLSCIEHTVHVLPLLKHIKCLILDIKLFNRGLMLFSLLPTFLKCEREVFTVTNLKLNYGLIDYIILSPIKKKKK